MVERDGTLIMVDDDRLPLAPGEEPRMEKIRFRTLGCYPLTGAIRSDAETLPEIIAEMRASTNSERQGRLIDHDEIGFDGKEKARGIFLMLSGRRQSSAASARTRRAPSVSQDASAPPTLRLITCGSVDDGKSTLIGRLLFEQSLILEDQMAALERDFGQARHRRRQYRLRSPGRWIGGRARAGHHHRRRLSLFSRPRRSFIIADTPGHEQYTRNMATAASSADLADPPRRRAKGLADADPPPRRDRIADRHQTCRARRQQDRSDRFRPRRLRSNRGRVHGVRATFRVQVDHADSDFGAAWRQYVGEERQYALVCGPALLDFLESVDVDERSRRRSLSAFRCNGSTARISIFAASRGRLRAAPYGRAMKSSLRRPASHRRSRAS